MGTTSDRHARDRDAPSQQHANGDVRGARMLPHFEALHAAGNEPWSFSERAVEMLRHERVATLVRSLGPRRVLELGCSLGQMTVRLATLSAELCAIDLSSTAVCRARDRVGERSPGNLAGFAAGSAMQLPFKARAFDVILACDGLYGWELGPAERATALQQIHDVLAPGGHAVLTDHMRPAQFAGFVEEIRASPMRVVRVTYLYDRPCYQFESWLKTVQHWRVARALRRSMPLARALCAAGRCFGPVASRHICVVATRD